MLQKDAQNQADFCAMAAELDKKKAEFEEEKRQALETYKKTLRDKQAEIDAALCASQMEQNAAIHAE